MNGLGVIDAATTSSGERRIETRAGQVEAACSQAVCSVQCAVCSVQVEAKAKEGKARRQPRSGRAKAVGGIAWPRGIIQSHSINQSHSDCLSLSPRALAFSRTPTLHTPPIRRGRLPPD